MGPAEPTAGALTAAAAAPAIESGAEPLHVLVLEDRAADAELMLHDLRRDGFAPQAVRVDNEDEFVVQLDRPWDVILADYSLPQFDALRALDYLLERGLDVPLIVVSGSLDDRTALECIRRGASDYLLKDRLGRLGFAVRRAMAERRAHQRLAEQRSLLIREQAARAAAEAEREHLKSLFAQAPAAICLLSGADHVFTLANPRFVALVGARDVVGKPLQVAVPEFAAFGMDALLEQVYATGKAIAGSDVQVLLDRGGALPEDTWFNFAYAPLRGADNQVDGIFVQAVDITDQVRARALVIAERDRLQQVIDNLPEGIAIADHTGRILMSNASAQTIWGQAPPPVDLHGYDAFGMYHLDGSPYPSEESPIARSILHGDVVYGDQLLIQNASSGDQTPVLVNSAPLRGEDGRITGGVAVFQDISLIKEFEAQKDEFLAAASHDLKNPLSAIKGRAQLLLRQAQQRPETDERLANALRIIDETASRATALLDQLVDLTRLEMGRPLPLDRTAVDLTALTRRIVADLQQTSEQHTIALESEVEAVEGSWDGPRLERVLGNLLNNAIKYSPAGGTISVRVRREGGTLACVDVCDPGVGIPEDEVSRIFDRFFRASNVSGKISGTGIGLAGARQIVEQHGGTIAVRSTPGQGATFTVCLPLAAGV